MKKLLFIFLLFGYIAQGQVYTPQTAAGYQFKRIKGDSTVYIPTFCGTPNLRSINPQLQGGIALDSCNNLFYYYSPKTKQWYSLPQISQITVIDSTSIQICNFNSCDTFLTTVNPQLVTILNDSTLLVCANTDPPECDTLDVGRRQFVNNLFDTTNIYQTIQNLNIYVDSLIGQTMPLQVLVDTVYRINDSVTAYLYTNDSLVYDTIPGLLTLNNIYNILDTIPDTTFMVSHQTIDGNNILYATQDPNSDNDSIHVDLHPEGHAGQVLGSTGTGVAWVSQNDHHANQLVYGGIVTWLHDYVYNVSPSGYYINDVFYESPSTDITLDAADATNDRIDLFVLTTSSTATDITGTPAGTPVAPDYDANTQLQISFAIVYAGTTEPPVTTEWIYKENTEWTTSASVGAINPNSTNNPYAGSKDVEGTNVGNAAYITFSSPVSTVDFSKYNFLTFQIRSKGNFATTKKLVLTWFRAPSNATGNNVPIGSGSYGFISTMTASYQTISIPLSDFGNISTANILRITESNTSGTAGWYIDNIQLQYIPVTTPSNDVVFYGKNATGDSTILLLKNGSRYAALDSVGTGGGGSVAWGDITGTLSDQTDLQSALDAKQDNLTLTTTGSSGPATLIGSTLNIPQYSGGGGGAINLYNTDSTLAGDRTVTMDNHFLSLNGGNVLVGTGINHGFTFDLYGTASINLSGDTTGDMYYRNSLGSFTRLPPPTGFTKPILGYTTIPTWQEDSTGGVGGGSSDSTLYKTDGTLAGNRTVTMANRWLSFNGGNVGIGATSTSPASLLTLSRAMPVSASIVPEDSTGLNLRTSAAATVGNSSSAPGIVFESNGWNTTAGASQSAKFKLYGSSASASSLLGNFYIGYSSNGGAYTQPFQLVGPNGNLIITGAFVAGTTITGTTHTGTNFVATRNMNNGTNYLDNSTIVSASGTTQTTSRSFYFNPTITSQIGVDLRGFENTIGSVVLNSTSGSTSIGSSDTIVGAKLAVTSTTGAFLPPRMTKAQRDKIYSGFTGSITNAGSGTAISNTYLRAMTGGSGTGATASIVIASNIVTSVTILEYGTGYVAGDVLSVTISGLTGFTWTISAVTAPKDGSVIYQTDNTPGLREMENGAWVKFTTTADP